jgi:hypothetical protein
MSCEEEKNDPYYTEMNKLPALAIKRAFVLTNGCSNVYSKAGLNSCVSSSTILIFESVFNEKDEGMLLELRSNHLFEVPTDDTLPIRVRWTPDSYLDAYLNCHPKMKYVLDQMKDGEQLRQRNGFPGKKGIQGVLRAFHSKRNTPKSCEVTNLCPYEGMIKFKGGGPSYILIHSEKW